jgi:Winged helix DNA-binding domain
VARTTCGIHAQVQASAELQLATRVDGIVQADIRRALWEERSLVKAWTLRGTLHLHPAEELPLWFAARRAVSAEEDELPAWPDPKGVVHPPVSADEVVELRAAVWDAFEGRALLREELATAVVERVGPKHEGRLRSGFAFFISELCQGPPQGNKITLARPDQWLSSWQEVDEREALHEIVRRFLHAYGPARPQDFREWFRADVSFDVLELEEVDVEGRRAFVLAGDTEFPQESDVVRLVPEYDVYVMGFREREHLVPEPVRAQVAAHGRGRYEGPAGVRFLLVDGVAGGLWERKKVAKQVRLSVHAARKLTRRHKTELENEAERIGAFLGLEPVLTVE